MLITRRSNSIILHLVSSHSVGGRPVRRLREEKERERERESVCVCVCHDTRCCIIKFVLLMMSTTVLETCTGI